jgi:nickel/cobalt exporter
MTPLTDLIQQGAAHAWLFIPSAILLGALHGLEPGHSKTMMAAFIIAVRGTVRQAVLLGLCATLSHTLIVWVIALGGLYLWRGLGAETVEPWLQLASAAAVISMAAWMIWRTRREQRLATGGRRHDHDHDHDHHHHSHSHSHHHHHHEHPDDGVRRIDTGHGVLALSIAEDGAPPRFRLQALSGHGPAAGEASLEIERPGGARRAFAFAAAGGGVLQSTETVAEPHDFVARLRIAHGDHAHSYDVAFVGYGHVGDHDHIHEELRGLDLAAGGYQDAHELAHANDIRRRFADRNVTTGQIALFGLTGGLIPCPGAITVLILCLQLKRLALGATLVASFSVGLALTMVAAGVVAALSVRHVTSRWPGFERLVRRAPYFSGVVILALGVYVGVQGWLGLMAQA